MSDPGTRHKAYLSGTRQVSPNHMIFVAAKVSDTQTFSGASNVMRCDEISRSESTNQDLRINLAEVGGIDTNVPNFRYLP